MLKLLLIFLFVPIITFSQTESTDAIVADNIRIRFDENQKKQFIDNLNEFLYLKDRDMTNFILVDSINYYKYKDIFDELKFIENNTALKDSSFYKAYLVNFVKQSETSILITLAFRGIQENIVTEKARVTLLAEKTDHGFKFLNPFDFYTKDWNSREIKNINFHYRGSFNTTEALSFVNHGEHLANLFGVKPYSIDYFNCRDLQEVYQLFGLDYHIDINGEKEGCVTIPEIALFVSGTNRDDYNHDLTHYYFQDQVPKASRNWFAEEGYNINTTDYWGYSTEETYHFLREYLKNNDVTPLEIFEKNRILKNPIPTKMPVAAVVMRKIEREYGIEGVMKIVYCGNKDADFFRAIKKVAKITKENFNETVETELKKE